MNVVRGQVNLAEEIGKALSLACLLALAGVVRADDPLLVHDLAGLPTGPEMAGKLTRIHGSTGNGGAGTPVAGGVDCDGDGFGDSALASIQAGPLGRALAGEIVLVFGDGSIGGAIDTAGFSAGQLKVAGSHAYEVAGAEIWMDDVTGDGIGDLLIGRQNHSPNDGDDQNPVYRLGAGALTILVGGPELRTAATALGYLDLSVPPDGVTLFHLVGGKAFDRLGIWMRTGDVNGDGVADIVVGADQEDSGTEANRGAVYVIQGGAHLAVNATVDLAGFGTTSLAGRIAKVIPPVGSANFHFGSTTQACDLDGNGRAEVLASAALQRAGAQIGIAHNGVRFSAGFSAGVGGSARGSAFVIWDDNFPAGLWPAGLTIDLEELAGGRTILGGGAENRAFGEELVGGFDLDGGGGSELAVGDIVGLPGGVANAGSAHVFMNAAELKGRDFDMDGIPGDIRVSVISGTRAGAISGDTMGFGVFDGDGLDDLVVGNPHDWPQGRANAGSLHVLYGRRSGWPMAIPLSEGNQPPSTALRIARVDAAKAGDVLCYSLAVGDMDGDGRPDLIVNEMLGDGLAAGTEDVGNAAVVSGASLLKPSPRLTGMGFVDGGTEFRFESFGRIGKQYRLEGSVDFGVGGWGELAGPFPGSDEALPWSIPVEGISARFFRVIEEPLAAP